MPSEDKHDEAQEHNWRGNDALRNGEFDKAVSSYSKGLALHAEGDIHSILLSNRSSAYAHLERWEDAIEDANECVHLRPDWSRSHACRGAALEGLGRTAEAVLSFQAAAKLDPDNAELRTIVKELEQIQAANAPAQQAGPEQPDQSASADRTVEFMGPAYSDSKVRVDRRGGIGMALAFSTTDVMTGRQSRAFVDGLAPWSPLRGKGISAGDRLTAVDGTNVEDVPFHVVQSLIRGEPGTPVTLAFKTARPYAQRGLGRTSSSLTDAKVISRACFTCRIGPCQISRSSASKHCARLISIAENASLNIRARALQHVHACSCMHLVPKSSSPYPCPVSSVSSSGLLCSWSGFRIVPCHMVGHWVSFRDRCRV